MPRPRQPRDPATLGVSKHRRHKLDFYPTETPVTVAGLRGLERYLRRPLSSLRWRWWEPFCGNGAISNVLKAQGLDVLSTDLRAYDGFDFDGRLDFRKASVKTLQRAGLGKPDIVFSNPPYGREAAIMAAKAVEVMEEPRGLVVLLCRREWDAAPGRATLLDHPAFAAEIVLRWRPRWVEYKPGDNSPRFPYAWFVWDWGKDPAALPVVLFEQRPAGV